MPVAFYARTLLARLRQFWTQLENRDLGALAIMLLVSAMLFGFAKLASEVMEGETDAFDRAILLAFRTPGDVSRPLGPAWIEVIFRDLTSLGSLPVVSIVAAAVLGFLWVTGRHSSARLVLVSVAVGALLSVALKLPFQRPRPVLFPHGVEATLTSFPSGHATLAAVVYLTLGVLLAREQTRSRVSSYCIAVAITLTLLVGTSRVYLGVHWPTDVLAGWCVGAAWAILCLLGATALERRRSHHLTD